MSLRLLTGEWPETSAPASGASCAIQSAEEAEIVGLYLNGPDGRPYRIGYALGNEYSDHVTEAANYL